MCQGCGRKLYFKDRIAHPQAFCFACATTRGLIRISDKALHLGLRSDAKRRPAWWRWTVYLHWAIQLLRHSKEI